jgi:fructan beta-fructosidase
MKPLSSVATALLLASAAFGSGVSGNEASNVARWSMDEGAAPFADSQHHAGSLARDPATGTPTEAPGVRGNAARLQWDGISTRLAAYGSAVQRDSFGFSFWVRPQHLDNGDSLIGKEIAAANVGPAFSRLAWHVHVGKNDGSGHAPVVFLVRGSERTSGDFHGSITSTIKLPLGAESPAWFHIAGGYDVSSGKLVLHVNGAETSTAGLPGAQSSDGGAFVVGSMVNGDSFINYAALADIDEVQLYDHPLTDADAQRLMADPSRIISPPAVRSFAGRLVAHWKLDEAGPWIGDWSGHENNLTHDGTTSAPQKVAGVDGDGLLLSWQENPGVATRLSASGSALQIDSFGFSFWLRPVRLATGENLIAKEMPPTVGEAFVRMAWQVQVGPDDGSGMAPLELVVRGCDRSRGNFFGSVISSAVVPLSIASDEWMHMAGGYDAGSGGLCLFVNGEEFSSQGTPGARNSDGSWFNLGSVRNGLDFVAYGAIAAFDDIQLYDAPLSAYEATYLKTHPGAQFTPDKHLKTTLFQCTPRGGFLIDFQSIPGWHYLVEGSHDLDEFRELSWLVADGPLTREIIGEETMEQVMGGSTLSRFFGHVRALLPNDDDSFDQPPAEILPFANPAAYVPQFHFSFASAAVGDPCGVLRYDGKYHFFTWDHASSDDLVTWDGMGWPLGAAPPDSGYWTGSVVVDKNNTSGFGTPENPPMVAIYTIHNNVTGKETIGISYSTNHRDFIPYAGNPVIVTGDQVFRDPDVFWDTQTNRWIMVVARSQANNLQFYGSSDLKSWQFLSDFGPVGASNEIWECPGLTQIPVKDAGHQKKWMLQVGAGTNKTQYWVGHFDGTRFTMDEATRSFLENGTGLEGDVLSDFEQADFWDAGWTYTGSAFGSVPAHRSLDQPARGHLGQRMASSYVDGDWHTGSALTSHEFTIGKNCINFQIGGGNHPGQTCMNLIVDGNVVRTATGDNSNLMRWAGWNVEEFKGRTARLQIVDDFGGFWGRIYIDHILFSDILTDHRREHANWVEFGPDFFAPKFLRDFDGTEQDVKWTGWIGSWEYETSRPVPQNWGKGAESIFRKLQLVASPKGYQLHQQPDISLQQQRGPVVNVMPQRVAETMPLRGFHPATNTYEIEATFNLADAGKNFGLHFCVGGGQRVTVGFDTSSSTLYLDRQSSGHVSWHPGFPKIVSAPLKTRGGQLKLRVFVDQCAIEVFAEDGQQVLTSQIYPDPAHTGIELFSTGGATTLGSFRAWPLASIWKP